MNERSRPSFVSIDLARLRGNTTLLAQRAVPAELCAVVKADAYGHGVLACARAALAGGATSLAVALVEEAAELRADRIGAPILLLSEPPPGNEQRVVELDIEPTVYTRETIAALDDAAEAASRVLRVHLKIDTGMRRVGAEVNDALDLAKQIDTSANLDLHATWTHFAVADEPDDPFTIEQAERFDATLADFAAAGIDPGIRHVANSAALIVDPGRYAYDMVRVGIAIYGIAPSRVLEGRVGIEPVLSLRSELSYVRRVPAGVGVSYGLTHTTPSATTLGTVPLGYADGVRRNLSNRFDVLVHGERRPAVGTVTMDQFMVDLGDLPAVRGDDVVLIGSQATDEITALDWADTLGTIGYEVTCGIGARVPREYVE